MLEFEDSTSAPRRSLLVALAGFDASNALQMQQTALWDLLLYGGLLVLAVAAYWSAGGLQAAWRNSLVLLALAGLGFSATGLRSHLYLQTQLDPALEGRDVQVTGVVTDLPQRNESGLRFRLKIESASLEGKAIAIPPRVDVGWYGGVYSMGGEVVDMQRQPQDLKAGERWRMTLRLKAPHGGRNPFGFDYELWLWEQGVQATAYVRAGPRDAAPLRLAQTWQHPVALARQSVRDRIFSHIESRQVAGLVAGLVVGDQSAIERVDWDVFRATGVAHLVSISGLHITMFAWGASLLISFGWRKSTRLCLWLPSPTAALLGGVLTAVAYSLFSGWGIPAQRTCLMLACISVLRLLGARWPWPQVWMGVCAVVVAFDPWALMQAGFWLSFVAVGVLFATDNAMTAMPKEDGALDAGTQALSAPASSRTVHYLHRFAQSLRDGLREQWVITVALTPLTLLLFGQVSLVGLVANAFAIPWVTLVLTPLAMVGAVLPWAWDAAAWSIQCLMGVLQFLAALPWATLTLAAAPVWAGAAGVAGGVLLVAALPWHVRLAGVPLMLPVLLWQAPLPQAGQFELLAADIGQGNAVLVRTAHHALLFDAGPRYSLESDAGHRVLVPLLQALQTRLDMLVLSHRDTDHVGGAAAVLAMQPQAQLLSSIEDDNRLQSLRRAQRCVAGQHWEWDGVLFEILHPQAPDYLEKAKPNAMSCVLKISNGLRTALLVGDIERPQEERLVASGVMLHADVLLVPHHGSKTSSSDIFLQAVQPGVALVQSGYRNRFGHPAAPVMQRYADKHIVVHDSPHCGAMTWLSTSPDAVQCARMEQLRYWSHRVP